MNIWWRTSTYPFPQGWLHENPPQPGRQSHDPSSTKHVALLPHLHFPSQRGPNVLGGQRSSQRVPLNPGRHLKERNALNTLWFYLSLFKWDNTIWEQLMKSVFPMEHFQWSFSMKFPHSLKYIHCKNRSVRTTRSTRVILIQCVKSTLTRVLTC